MVSSALALSPYAVARSRLATFAADAMAFLPMLVIALLVVAAFWGLARLVTSLNFLFGVGDNTFVQNTAKRVTRFFFVVGGILIALELLNATALVGAVLGTAGVLGIAVGFAFQDLIENYLAGILLSFRRPFDPNDFIDIGGNSGKVIRLTSRSVILLTLGGNHLRIPNADVFKGVILNYTRNPFRRFDFLVGVGVNEDLQAAQQQGLAILGKLDAVAPSPPTMCLIESLGDSSVALHFFGWVDQGKNDFCKTRSEAIRLVKTAFDQANIEMPEPTYRVHLVQSEAAPKRSPRPLCLTGDVSIDHHIDQQVARERQAEGDLLPRQARAE